MVIFYFYFLFFCLRHLPNGLLPPQTLLVLIPQSPESKISISPFCIKVKIVKLGAEAAILNNLCPSRFSQVCPDLHFLRNANMYRKCV